MISTEGSAGGGTRTHTSVKIQVPKTCASTSSATPALSLIQKKWVIVPLFSCLLILGTINECLAQEIPDGMTPVQPTDDLMLDNLQSGLVRIGNCSGAMVTSSGLVLTSYSCAKRSILPAWRIEHIPLDEGFMAREFMEERFVPDLFVDHLIEVQQGDSNMPADSVWESEHGVMNTEVIASDDSTEYWAYTYRRYGRVSVVWAPELEVASFGGDKDVSTYPRYALGAVLLRVYEDDGSLISTEKYLPVSLSGISSSKALHSIGFMGSVPMTSEGQTGSYPYNGTWAPPFTTLYGLFDLHFSHGPEPEWLLPEAWLDAHKSLDLSTPLNFVTTTPCAINGAPLVNSDVELVGIAFDQTLGANITWCIGVSASAIYEVLLNRYGAEDLAVELELEGTDE